VSIFSPPSDPHATEIRAKAGRILFKLLLIVGPLNILKHSIVAIVHLNCNFFSTSNPNYSRTPLIQTLVIQISNNLDRFGPSGKFVKNSTKPTCLEIPGYRFKYRTVLWVLELQIRHGQKV
jgi:hypothetical protein